MKLKNIAAAVALAGAASLSAQSANAATYFNSGYDAYMTCHRQVSAWGGGSAIYPVRVDSSGRGTYQCQRLWFVPILGWVKAGNPYVMQLFASASV